MQAYMQESTAALAEARDAYIGTIATQATQASTSAAITTASGAKAAVDLAFTTLWNNGVKITDDVVITITPWFYTLFKGALTESLTDNVNLIKKGLVGTYNGAAVKMSNNLYNDATDDYMMIRTKNAIAFASGIEKTEAYRPDKQFSDAIKILDTYGAKLVRPEELYVIKARKS
jgi:hypothetical protein